MCVSECPCHVPGSAHAHKRRGHAQARTLQLFGLAVSVRACVRAHARAGAQAAQVMGLYMYRSRLLSDWARWGCVALALALVGGAGAALAVLFLVGCADVSCADLLADVRPTPFLSPPHPSSLSLSFSHSLSLSVSLCLYMYIYI